MPGTSGKYLESVSSGWVNAGVAWLGTADARGARNTVIASTAAVASRAGAVTARRRSGRMGFSFGAGHGRRLVERAVETQVDRGDDEQAEQGGGDQAAEDDDSQRVLDLVARAGPEDDERHEGETGGERRHEDRGEALLGAPDDQREPELHPLLLLEVLVVVDEQDPVAGRDPEDGEEAHERPERQDPAGEPGREDAADEGHGQREEHEDGEPPAPERRLEQQEDEDPGHDSRGEQPALGGLALLVLPEDLRVVAAGEADPRELGVELGDD